MLFNGLVLLITSLVFVAAQVSSAVTDVRRTRSGKNGCRLPENPQYGEYQMKDPKTRLKPGNLVEAGSTLVYFCDQDYEPSAKESVCLENGSWSSASVCKCSTEMYIPSIPCSRPNIFCVLPSFPKNGTFFIQNYDKNVTAGEPVGVYTMLFYSCDTGFQPTKEMSICLDGGWSSFPACVPIKDPRCVLPPFPENGSYAALPFDVLEVIPGELVDKYTIMEVLCDYGFEATKTITVCGDDNQWSTVPTCLPRKAYPLPPAKDAGCVLPDRPQHGYYTLENYRKPLIPGEYILPFSVLNYHCNENYEPSVKLAVCMGNKTWSSKPVCRKSCKMVFSRTVKFVCLSHDRASLLCDHYLPHGSTVHPSCKAGHFANGELETLRCVDGSWDNSTPKCKRDDGTTPATLPWRIGIFQDFGGYVMPICGFLQSNVIIGGASISINNSTNKQTLPANYYTLVNGRFYKMPDDQLEPDIVKTSSQGPTQGNGEPESESRPNKPTKRPPTTTSRDPFTSSTTPGISFSHPWTERPKNKPHDDSQTVGDFVASSLRNFNSDQNRRLLKQKILEMVLESTKNDDYLSFVLTPHTTTSPQEKPLDEEIEYYPETDTVFGHSKDQRSTPEVTTDPSFDANAIKFDSGENNVSTDIKNSSAIIPRFAT